MKSPTSSVGTIELDGIYVINFSGGGPETDPVTDALIETVKNTAAAGVVPVIAAGNDRDDFGLGSVGSPGTAPAAVTVAAVMISDLDGANLRAYLAGTGGRAAVRIGNDPVDVENGRGDVMTSFSSAGPTDFRHLLKPDVSAPGGQILSSTLPEFAGSPFAVFDGTSMATPHVAGSAALLLELHPGWSAQQVKSALVSTAGAAWSDTTQAHEAPVLLEGGGLVNLPRAANPLVFTDPASLSFPDLDVNGGAQTRSQVVHLTDAGGGVGTWTVSVEPQSASAGATLDVPGTVTLAPGGETDFTVAARAAADAAKGDDYGF